MKQSDFEKAVARILREMKRSAEEDVRRRWREEEGLIFVREYTVRAHVYRRRLRPRRAASGQRARR